MSYNKTTWSTGDTITAEKLNNIEGGIEEANSGDNNNILLIHAYGIYDDYDETYTYTADKYAIEIKQAVENGKTPLLIYNDKILCSIMSYSYSVETEQYSFIGTDYIVTKMGGNKITQMSVYQIIIDIDNVQLNVYNTSFA